MSMIQNVHSTARRTHTSRVPGGIVAWLKSALAVQRTRRELSRLDARALEDVGLTQSDVQRELNRPFWDVPGHWKR